MTDGDRRLELPDGVSREEERAIIAALERFFVQESPKPSAWVLQGRVETLGVGALQVRRLARDPWHGVQGSFARRGVPTVQGRGDAR